MSAPPQPHHVNGAIPSTPAPISNGSAHPHGQHQIVSPTHTSPSLPNRSAVPLSIQKLTQANEQTWLLIGAVAEQMGDLEHALSAYENALRHNPMSLTGLTQVAGIARIKENYPKAVEYFQRVLAIQQDSGEVWSALGHCYLMQDDLQKAYAAYQQALYLLPNPKEDPKLWYGIGILYDRYGSLDHAEDAFASVLRMDKNFDKSNEILFRLGIIYKQQGKYNDSLRCFEDILRNPPSPLAHADIWFQIGHVYEQQKDHLHAKDAYEHVVAENPGHAKVLQQLGWLYHQDGSSFQNQDLAIQYLTKSLEADPSDAQSWYLLGRAYMAGQKYNKAYEAYQQAVYRDGRNPTFWCSIGVLYFQINQFHDALDAYSRAIRINPYISEVWFDLGSLYESCNNQISDAIDAYARAAELDPTNPVITQRLQLLKQAQATGSALPAAPGPQDVHPTAYASAVVPPPGPPMSLHMTHHPRPLFRTESRGPPPADGSLSLPPPPQVPPPRTSSPGPFRGGPPPPVVVDESRQISTHTPLARMELDRPAMHGRHSSSMYPPAPETPSRGPAGHQSILLHHPVPQQQYPSEDMRGAGSQPHLHDPYAGRPLRVPSTSTSPPPPGAHGGRPRSPPVPQAYQGYGPSGRSRVGPGQAASQRSPRAYAYDGVPPVERDTAWDRRPAVPSEHRDWERERRVRHSADYSGNPSQQSPMYPPPRGVSPISHRSHTPRDRSPEPGPRPTLHSSNSRYWETKPSGPGSAPGSIHLRHSSPPPMEMSGRRYDPRFDARDAPIARDFEREPAMEYRHDARSYGGSPEGMRGSIRASLPPPPPPLMINPHRGSESPRLPPQMVQQDPRDRRKRNTRDKDTDSNPSVDAPKEKRKRRTGARRATKDESQSGTETPKPFQPGPSGERPTLGHQIPSFKVNTYGPSLGKPPAATPEPGSSNGSGSANRSVQPSPTSASAHPPNRVVDEDYDEGVADALMGLAGYRGGDARAPSANGSNHSPHVSALGRPGASPRVPLSHRGSISSQASPPMPSNGMKRPLSPGPDEMSEMKRSRMEVIKRRGSSPSAGRRTPGPSTRPSPIPFRQQPSSHSPESRQPLDGHAFPPSPTLPAVLPPHPRPIGAGLSSRPSQHMTLPPIATLSPTSTGSPPGDDRMRRDASRSRSRTPPAHLPSRSKISDVMNHPGGSPPGSRMTPLPVQHAPKAEPVS
ncbi:TPR-like protein [Heliocybe sulcata]|uniref:TPR-like protein n=1 Tax=Heliocybe sulcata TaxID=5364 RepID=A0A5C3MSD1_9AGAM|nr:TPR-like protein [Heliocybe sulcata]